MRKRLLSLAFKLLSINFLVTILTLFLMPGLLGITDNALFLWSVTTFFAAGLWLLAWFEAATSGQKDVQKDKIIHRRVLEEQYTPVGEEGRMYQSWMGFVAGLIAQVPILLVTIVAVSSAGTLREALSLALALWHIPYQQVLNTFSAAQPWLFFLFPFAFAAVAGFGYRSGPARQRRTETIIERNSTRKARLMRDQKTKRQRPPKRKPR